MQDEEELTPADRELEDALGSLSPRAPAINRDALMFRAGRASARRGGVFWRAACVALGACLAISLARGPEVRYEDRLRVVERIVRVDAAPSDSPVLVRLTNTPLDTEYIRVRNTVLQRGLGALPASSSAPGGAEDLPELRELLGQQRQPAASGAILGRFLKFIYMGA